MKLAQIASNEALLATELLLKEQNEAEAETPQEYDAFVQGSEKEAIKEKEEPDAGDDFSSDSPGENEEGTNNEGQTDIDPSQGQLDETSSPPEAKDPSEATEDSGSQQESVGQDSDPFADSIADEATPTNESLSEWISEKTRDSSSGVVRNVGALASGLAHIGVTYGPATLNYMFKGVLWTFSRMGTMIFDTTKALSGYIEKSNNSISKLEERLSAAESVISEGLNNGSSISKFSFNNQKAIDFITIGSNTDVNSNLRAFSESLVTSTKAVAAEFEKGLQLVEKMANTSSDRVGNLKPWMEVDVPRAGFVKGSLPGYEVKSNLVEALHTEPIWPGDASLVFLRPIVNSNDLSVISQAYSKTDMFVALSKNTDVAVPSMSSLTGTQALIYAKGIRILIAAMKETIKTQERMKAQGPTFAVKAKRLFIRMADDKAKVSMSDSMVEPMFLRASLSQSVYVNGSKACLTHASRVAASAITYLEAHASKIVTSTE